MAAAATALEPYSPVPGLSAREQHARAHEHINTLEGRFKDLVRKHSSLTKAHDVVAAGAEKVKASGKVIGLQVVEAAVATVGGGILGVIDGRWGGEAGHFTMKGVPLDATLGIAAHLAGIGTFAFTEHHVLSRMLHAVGDVGLGATGYRVGKGGGVAWAQKAAAASGGAGSPPTGARGGTVFNVTPPHK